MLAPPSVRVLSTGRSTLLPFLYGTRTIQQIRPRNLRLQLQARLLHRTRALRRSGYESDHDAPSILFPSAKPGFLNDRSPGAVEDGEIGVPFEHESVPEDRVPEYIDEVEQESGRPSTMTETERKIFERLYKSISQNPGGKKDMDRNTFSQPLDEGSIDELDAILERASRRPKPGESADRHQGSQSMREVAQSALGLRSSSPLYDMPDGDEGQQERDPIRIAQREQFQRVERTLRAANTDLELWNVLENEVFAVIRRLDLDGKQQGALEGEATAAVEEMDQQKISDLAIIGPNYPSFLLIAVRQLRMDFPSSSLILAIIPAIKKLGRGSYALGASTLLYNELIKALWLIYSDFQAIDELLQEMENGGVEFDNNTLDLLDRIRMVAGKVKGAHIQNPDEFTTVWQTERFKRGLKKIVKWREVIWGRLEADALRHARERSELFNN